MKIDFRLFNYLITDQALYIQSTQKMNAISEVEELDHTQYIMQDSLKIIKEACIYYGSSYQGRVSSVKELFNRKQNPPIPIDPKRGIYAFPTRSPRHHNNIWVLTTNIKTIEQRDRFSIIYYNNGKTLVVQLSKYQVDKVLACLYKCYLHFR